MAERLDHGATPDRWYVIHHLTRDLARHCCVTESRCAVGAVAERLVGGASTAAKINGALPAAAEGAVLGVQQLEDALELSRIVILVDIASFNEVMRTAGVEPAPLAGQDPKSCASASSATLAPAIADAKANAENNAGGRAPPTPANASPGAGTLPQTARAGWRARGPELFSLGDLPRRASRKSLFIIS
jgi:hypothetical protein